MNFFSLAPAELRVVQMCRRWLVVGGLWSVVLVPSASAAMPEINLYDRMLLQTKQEQLLSTPGVRQAEFAVRSFVAGMIELPQGRLSPEDIDSILNADPSFCDAREGRDALIPSQCEEVKSLVRQLVRRESDIRALGRDLESVVAGSFERPLLVSEFSPQAFLTEMQAVTSLWRVSDGSDERPPIFALRVSSGDEGSIAGSIEYLRDRLNDLIQGGEEGDATALTAAVLAERYGHWNAFGSTPRNDGVHEALENIASDLGMVQITPELQPGESAFFLFSNDLQSMLPRGVRLWAYAENRDGFTERNVGLSSDDSADPLLPILCDWNDGGCAPRLAGRYPEPPRTPGLCGHRLGQMGYLCRVIPDDSETACRETPIPAANTIALARCQSPKPPVQTNAGPDVCREWAEGKSQMLGDTPRCNVQIVCSDPGNGFDSATTMKGDDGQIGVLLKDNALLPPKYLALEQLTHAKRFCAGPPMQSMFDGIEGREEMADVCCNVQFDAAMAACRAMYDDGVFGAGSTAGGLPLTIDTCAQALTENTCRSIVGTAGDLGGVCRSLPVSALSEDDLRTVLNDIGNAAYSHLPENQSPSCSTLQRDFGEGDVSTSLAEEDPRVGGAIRAVNDWRQDVCTPGNTVQFRSTIGDAECYLNLCLLQSLRDHRLTPGSTPLVSGAVAQPFDACVPPTTDRGSIRAVSQTLLWSPPAYNPVLFLKQAQIALCLGGPPSTLCDGNISRFLRASIDDPIAFSLGVQRESALQEQTKKDVAAMVDALGQRLGNDLYAAFLTSRVGVINGVVREAGEWFAKLTRVRFPDTLCPANPGDRRDFLSSNQCDPSQMP